MYFCNVRGGRHYSIISTVLLWLIFDSPLKCLAQRHDLELDLPISSSPSKAHHYGSYKPHSKTFNVFFYGATGDGATDDSKAFKEAWKAACLVPRATVEIPSGFTFLTKPITLEGPCMPHLILQIDGTLVAPHAVAKSMRLLWVNIKWLHDFTLQGSGTVDDQGFALWNSYEIHDIEKDNKDDSSVRPTILRFYKCYNVTIHGIQIINSPQCHLKFDNSISIRVRNISISSPKDSPNTDGITTSKLSTLILDAATTAYQYKPGALMSTYTISDAVQAMGSVWEDLGEEIVWPVSLTSPSKTSLFRMLFLERIKTWQGGIGLVKNLSFSNVRVDHVDTPIVIDQYYCNKKWCRNKTDAVAISEVMYRVISGTYSFQPVHIACSDSMPCTGVVLEDIKLYPVNETQVRKEAFCWNSYGESNGLLQPSSVGCLERTTSLVKALTKSHNDSCY